MSILFSMNCKAFRRQLEDLSTDRFLCDEAQSHAALCHACADFYRQHLTLNQLIQSIEPVCAPPDFDNKVNARLDAVRRARPTPRFLYLDFIPGTASIVCASVFALVVCTAVLLKETQSLVTDAPRIAQQTQFVGSHTEFTESARPAPLNNMPAVKRAAYANLAGASPKILPDASLKKMVGGKPVRTVFDDSRREAAASEKNRNAIALTPPTTKSVVFSSGAGVLVMRPTASNSKGTQNPPDALTESARTKDRPADLFLASGVEIKMLTAQLASGDGSRGGLLIVSVQPESAAFRAGLRSGDVLEAANNQSLSGARLPQNLKDTNSLSLTVVRGNQRFFVTLPVTQSTRQ